jgi:hypothetical protein
MLHRVTPIPHNSALPDSEASGRPCSSPSCSASDAFLGLPLVLHLRLHRRWITRLPRLSHLSAVPTGQSPGCPGFRSFGIADDPLRRLPCFTNLPVPADGSPSYLGSRTIRFAIGELSGFPEPLSSGSASGRINQGFPKSNVLRRSPIVQSPGCPESQSPGCPSMLPQVAPTQHLRLDR